MSSLKDAMKALQHKHVIDGDEIAVELYSNYEQEGEGEQDDNYEDGEF